jgi:hypothetical protein
MCVSIIGHLDLVLRLKTASWNRRELTLRSSPTSLSDVEAASYRPRVRLAALCIYEALLRLDDSAWLALVVYAQDLAPDLEFSAFGAYGQGLEKLDLALAV